MVGKCHRAIILGNELTWGKVIVKPLSVDQQVLRKIHRENPHLSTEIRCRF